MDCVSYAMKKKNVGQDRINKESVLSQPQVKWDEGRKMTRVVQTCGSTNNNTGVKIDLVNIGQINIYLIYDA